MIYFNKILISLVFIVIYSKLLPAQPFLFWDDHYNSNSVKGLSSRFIKINLANGLRDTFYVHNNLITDNLQSWIIEGDHLDYTVTNLSNKKYRINFNPFYAVYSNKNNALYITGENKDEELYAVLNTTSGKIEKVLPFKSYCKYGQMFLSKDENILYMPYYDSLSTPVRLNEVKLAYLSASHFNIIKSKQLSELGIPGADAYYLVNGKKGKAVIESKFDNEDNYYNIYDFDNDSNSPTIFYHGNADSYFTNNGKYLILAEKIDTQLNGKMISRYTGSVIIYNVSDQILVKSLALPENGIILNYDFSPDIMYYYYNPTGEIRALDIQSIATSFSK
jgi:hypothetical protein